MVGSWRAMALAWSLASAGCGGGGGDRGPVDDAGTGDVDAGFRATIAAPSAPAPPVFAPCGEGVAAAGGDDGTPSRCSPTPSECAIDEIRSPSTAACERLGAACPAGDFADDVPATGTVLYVRAGAPAGGDGTRSAPFATIRDALAAAPAGAVVALARGVYPEAIAPRFGVRVVGACVAETVIRPPAGSPAGAAAKVIDASATIERLRIEGDLPGVWTEGTSSIVLRDVAIVSAVGIGIIAWDARIEADGVAVRDTRPDRSHGADGFGISLERGATLTADRLHVTDTVGFALRASGAGSAARISNGWFERTRASSGASGGQAILLLDGAHVELRGVAVDDSEGRGIFVDASSVVIESSWVRGTRTAGQSGVAVLARDGSTVEMRGVVLDDNDGGLLAADTGSAVHAEDLFVRGTLRPLESGTVSHGIALADGVRLEARRVWIEDSVGSGLLAIGAGVTADIDDLVVRGARAAPGDLIAAGVAAQGGPHLVLRRARLEGNEGAQIAAMLPGTVVELEDLTAVDGRSLADGEWGRGLVGDLGATITGARLHFARNREAGLVVAVESTVDLTDVVVEETRFSACGEPGGGCEGQAGGAGALALAGGRLRLTRFALEANALAGVQIAAGAPENGVLPEGAPAPSTEFGQIDLSAGVIARHPMGANIQAPDYDFARITTDVLFVDNDRNIVADALPVPTYGGNGVDL